ncbi:hypothetical protein BC828DRAFT_409975 [Blastocladiella britannica]|nr:hypothetical protein BC828DRAFT_409975 [Blastocladiella britannica]
MRPGPSQPLTKGEYEEWYLVRDDNTLPPALYVTALRREHRTPIWQTAKCVAAYRHALNAHMGMEQRDVVLRLSGTASHFGDVNQETRTVDTAREFAFMHASVGVVVVASPARNALTTRSYVGSRWAQPSSRREGTHSLFKQFQAVF